MQFLTVSVVLFASAVLGFKPIKQQDETTTSNDLDNSVFSSDTTTNLPYIENEPVSGCFSHLPTAQDVDQTNNNVAPSTPFPQSLSDPIPPQFTPYHPPTQFHRPGPQGFYPNSPNYSPGFYPGRPIMPFVPHHRFPAPQFDGHNFVIVKLLQPIILPVAKSIFHRDEDRYDDAVDNGRDNNEEYNRPMYRRSAFNKFGLNKRFGPDNEEIETGRFVHGGFQNKFGFHKFGGHRRFVAEKFRNFDNPMPYKHNTFGPFKVGGGEENIQVTIKLN